MGNCLGKVLFDVGELIYTITPSSVPQNCPVQLNTDNYSIPVIIAPLIPKYIKKMIPQMSQLYPNSSILVILSLFSIF